MPKIFRGVMPTPQSTSPSKQPSQNGGYLGKPTKQGEPTNLNEPAKRKYSTKSQYNKYQTREDPIQGSGGNITGRLSAFKAKLRSRRAKKLSSSVGLFGSKSYIKLNNLKDRASGAGAVNIVGRHNLEQAQAREELIARHFGKEQGKWVSKKEYDQKISKLKKDAPWMASIQARQQAESDVKALEQLRSGN